MKRIIDIAFQTKTSHIGSSLTTYPILESIYSSRNPDDKIVLSMGHAGLAQYVALETFRGKNAFELHNKHGTHPHRDIENEIDVSSGSLGSAILIAVGMAFANRKRDVHCIISDGECAEGSVWEALSFAHLNNLTNLKIHVNINGYSAYDTVDKDYLEKKLLAFFPNVVIWKTKSPDMPCMTGLKAHYSVLTESEYSYLQTIL